MDALSLKYKFYEAKLSAKIKKRWLNIKHGQFN